jgi:hypothetical protein
MAASATYAPGLSGTVLGYHQNSLFEHSIAWVDGATAGTIPNATIPTSNVTAGFIVAVGVKFSEVTVPNTITVTITDSQHGIQIFTGTLTATGRIELDANIPYAGELTVAHSGNTTVNALGTTYILVA